MNRIQLLERILKDYEDYYSKIENKRVRKLRYEFDRGICHYVVRANYTSKERDLFLKLERKVNFRKDSYYTFWFITGYKKSIFLRIHTLKRLITHLKNKKGIKRFDIHKVYKFDGTKQ